MQTGTWGYGKSGTNVGSFPIISNAFRSNISGNVVNLHMSCNITLLIDTYFCIRVQNIKSSISVYNTKLVIY